MTNWQTQFNRLQQEPRVPVALTALFGFLTLTTLVSTAITLTTHHTQVTAIKKSVSIQPLENIADLHLFGIYSANSSNLPLTSLQLTLEGTVVSLETPEQSYALITPSGHPTKVYRTGDTLPGNATISRIAKHYVVLNDNGALEKLALPIETISP
jgi:type II secretory pathway component PulC